MSEKLKSLKKKLVEMFQLDQSELDFGIYRIMNEKSKEIKDFMDNKLLVQVKESFAKFEGKAQSALQKELEENINSSKLLGLNPDDVPKVKALKEQLSKAVDITALENEVFSHLTNFFSRYYEGGDFLSLRRYKKDVYAIPYEGEEVKLHWANADQYYIKSSENFRDYSFKLDNGKTVHFKLVEAETERDNNKALSDKERRFILTEEPLYIENNELYIKFQYIADETKSKQNKHNEDALEKIKTLLKDSNYKDFHYELLQLKPTEKNKNRTLLEKHLNDYTAKYSFDYFIHKDLGGFLSRELDFYIKNEVLFLDDLDEDNIKFSLSKAKTIKVIASKIIEFLAQLENFQKKIWLKKKFVVESGYCITLDKIAEEFYPEIIANKEQITEWENLFAISEIKGDMLTISGDILFKDNESEDKKIDNESEDKKIEFLKQNPFLVLDTKFFSEQFKEKLLAKITDLDEQTEGLLIHGDNFHALNLLQEKYKEKIKCTYIDPPYNTGEDGFVYKDNYMHSSWISMIQDRITLLKFLSSQDSPFLASINENELFNFKIILDQIYSPENYLTSTTIKLRHEDRILKGDKDFHEVTESLLVYRTSENHIPGKRVVDNSSIEDYIYQIRELIKSPQIVEKGGKKVEIFKENEYEILKTEPSENNLKSINIRGSLREGNSSGRFYVANIEQHFYTHRGCLFKVYDMGADGLGFRYFAIPAEEVNRRNGDYYQGLPLDRKDTKEIPYANFIDLEPEFNRAGYEGGIQFRNGKKPLKFLDYIFNISNIKEKINALILDFFAGSGTTGHAVINLNREDAGNRKYILVEMGEYFNTVTKPRIQKVIYSEDWKDGKPVSRKGSSHIFKYIKLESYEDALNNLKPRETANITSALALANENVQEQYMLQYKLEFEYKDSLLNLDIFIHPFDYKMKIANGTETKETKVDLVETFNYLIGLYVKNIYSINGFRVIDGITRTEERTLVIWRDLAEKDNTALDELFSKIRINPKDFEFDRIYVNGDNNLENLRLDEERWKVTLIEEEFKKRMF
jgi:adenine-specific DNA-methyltransferase